MGKKHDKKKKTTKVTLSLAEFNEDAGVGGIDPDRAALPSAPKAAEDWEAEGGRPEYNSRGYKERRSAYAEGAFDADAEFDDRDWTRKGPMDNPDAAPAGGPDRDWDGMRRGPVDSAFDASAPDRDWDGMRRGPVDAAFDAPDAAPRDWDGMRRGPVDAAFDAAEPARERDWAARKGPIDADLPSARVIDDSTWGTARKGPVDAELPQARHIDDNTWGTARKGPVDAEFPDGAPAAEPDWTVRKGPVEAEATAPSGEADWTVRKGPVDAETPATAAPAAERDWTQRKGPVEQDKLPTPEADWTQRKGPIDAQPAPRPEAADRDWSARKAPVHAEVENAQKGVRDIDFSGMRRGAKLQEQSGSSNTRADAEQEPEKERWRREPTAQSMNRTASHEARVVERPASTGHDAAVKERDWGAARRSQPLRSNPRQNRPTSARMSSGADAPVQAKTEAPEDATEDDWTTVRGAGQRRAPGTNRRLSGRDTRGGFVRRGPQRPTMRDSKGDLPIRTPIKADNSPNGSPVTPAVASAGSEM